MRSPEDLPADIPPDEIREKARLIFEDVRDCVSVYCYDEGEYGCDYGTEWDTPGAIEAIARALMERDRAATERAAKIAESRSPLWEEATAIAAAIRSQP